MGEVGTRAECVVHLDSPGDPLQLMVDEKTWTVARSVHGAAPGTPQRRVLAACNCSRRCEWSLDREGNAETGRVSMADRTCDEPRAFLQPEDGGSYTAAISLNASTSVECRAGRMAQNAANASSSRELGSAFNASSSVRPTKVQLAEKRRLNASQSPPAAVNSRTNGSRRYSAWTSRGAAGGKWWPPRCTFPPKCLPLDRAAWREIHAAGRRQQQRRCHVVPAQVPLSTAPRCRAWRPSQLRCPATQRGGRWPPNGPLMATGLPAVSRIADLPSVKHRRDFPGLPSPGLSAG
ncbi:unnamed protein product [Lampetra fluviatilis]